MTALVGGEVQRSLSVRPDLGGFTGEFLGSAATKPHHADRKDRAELTQVRGEWEVGRRLRCVTLSQYPRPRLFVPLSQKRSTVREEHDRTNEEHRRQGERRERQGRAFCRRLDAKRPERADPRG